MLIKGWCFIFKVFEFGVFFMLKKQCTIIESFQEFWLFGWATFVEFNASAAGINAVIICKKFIFFIKFIFHKAFTTIFVFIFAFTTPFYINANLIIIKQTFFQNYHFFHQYFSTFKRTLTFFILKFLVISLIINCFAKVI